MTFWQLTPHELSILTNAYVERMKREQDQQIIIAYLNAYWHRVKKMPNLKDVLHGKEKEKRKKSPEEMLEIVKQLNAAFGGQVSE